MHSLVIMLQNVEPSITEKTTVIDFQYAGSNFNPYHDGATVDYDGEVAEFKDAGCRTGGDPFIVRYAYLPIADRLYIVEYGVAREHYRKWLFTNEGESGELNRKG